MTILHGDDRFFNNIFVQKWPSDDFVVRSDSRDQMEVENRRAGTDVWDAYPTYEEWIAQFDMESDVPDMASLEPAHMGHLPVWSGGNAYFNGARAFRAEEDGWVDTEHTVSVELIHTEEGDVLKTDLYEYLEDAGCRMVSSDVLGKAFEPEERFENPDGSDILFDTDFSGERRGSHVIPGPFAKAVSSL